MLPSKKRKREKRISINDRTCIACGKEGDKSEFFRFVSDGEGKVYFDLKSKLPGRGAYVCINKGCVEKSARKGLFSKAFKSPHPRMEPSELLGMVYDAHERYLFTLMRNARGGRSIADGSSSAETIIKSAKAKLLLIPVDASEDTVKNIRKLAEKTGVKTAVLPEKMKVAEEVDSPLRAAYTVSEEGLAEALSGVLKTMSRVKRWL